MRGLLVLLLVIGAGCAEASGDVSGGEARFDAASPQAFDSGGTGEDPFTDAPPNTWKGIYRDYFGRNAKSSCAGSGVCHDAVGKAGSASSNFVCGDVDGCYTSLRTGISPIPSDGTRPLVDDMAIMNPDGAYLFSVIRYTTADGTKVDNRGMPQTPTDFYYKADDITRIKTWIAAGAPND